jgi:hypothetical protein
MSKDKRYKTVSRLILDGHIKSLNEIFDTIPKSVVAKDLGISGDRFEKMKKDVKRFSVKTLFQIADNFEVDEVLILLLVYLQHKAEKKGKKKSEDVTHNLSRLIAKLLTSTQSEPK